MRKTDISKYTDKIDVQKKTVSAGTYASGVWKVLKTVLAILVCTGIFISISLGIYVIKLAQTPTGIDLAARSHNLSSFISFSIRLSTAPKTVSGLTIRICPSIWAKP